MAVSGNAKNPLHVLCATRTVGRKEIRRFDPPAGSPYLSKLLRPSSEHPAEQPRDPSGSDNKKDSTCKAVSQISPDDTRADRINALGVVHPPFQHALEPTPRDSHNRSQPTCRGTSPFPPSAHHRWHMNPLSTNTRCHISSIFCAINKFSRVCLPTRSFCLLTQPEWPSFACHGPPSFGI
ncbi:hypothetical protein CDAR_281151 [Caerostris darwini]|uniref:Uncharacterized protein n=1 Tax=Caerostris darwini TaxID=1538125 RepID=A0AAV4NF42_9ARAC|nr:hypothetical protein CDAR_281151 [Caerostris darwini]